jgi:amino acid transporter
MINWLISPAKGLLQAAEHGFLPPFFARQNKHHVPVRLLVVQALLVSLFCLALLLMPSINAFYWFFTCLSTELYMIMYIILFACALKMGRPKEAAVYRIPRGTRKVMACLGLFGCLLTIGIGYVPPPEIHVDASRYALWIAAGNLALIVPAGLLCLYKKRFL